MKSDESKFTSGKAPFVCVVTPFYNTQDYLAECIESVLNQDYGNFEYILHDNASDDGSSEIALKYVKQDSRIKYFKTEELLSQVENYNQAVSLSSSSSRYLKIVQADDWLYPHCLRKMVALAERSQKIGLVSSYYLDGVDIQGSGLEYFQEVVPGSDVCELQLKERYFMFGSPTSVMYRKEAVKDREKLYAEGRKHEDTELAYEILMNWEFGFVHEVLSYLRKDDSSISGAAKSYNPQALDKFIIINKFGHVFIKAEYEKFYKEAKSKYYNDLAIGVFSSGGLNFIKYHLNGLYSAGIEVDRYQLIKSVFWIAVDLLLNPKKSLGRVYRFIKRQFTGEM